MAFSYCSRRRIWFPFTQLASRISGRAISSDEWLVIKHNVAFESASCDRMIAGGTFADFLKRIQAATLEEVRVSGLLIPCPALALPGGAFLFRGALCRRHLGEIR
jgi:hypothetical protein